MGSVWEAEDTVSGSDRSKAHVAVKLLAPELVDRDVFVRRFQREAAMSRALSSLHLASILDTGVDEEHGPFIVFERLFGEDLSGLIGRVPQLAPEAALRIAAQACVGLEAAHAGGVVHRDIKPSNLFLARVDDAVIVKLLDFGIAKPPRDLKASNLTQAGAVLGSPVYMSPEQARGGSTDVDARADLWSLGVVLYQMLAGRTPHLMKEGVGSLIVAICTESPAPIRKYAPWVTPAVAGVLDRALSLRRESRFQTAKEMREAIEQVVDPKIGQGIALNASMLVAVDTTVKSVPAPAAAAESSTQVTATSRAKTHILVIEDNEMNLDMLSRRLERKGYAVISALDGETGIQIARKKKPDLILMDIALPGMDGWQATRELRKAEETSATPIIALTAHAAPEDRATALDAGCDDYETKPVDLPRLLQKIESLLAHRDEVIRFSQG